MTTQRKLLSIDGGGIRGVLALEILGALEDQLARAHGVRRADFRLGDYFDYVSGTSTGAVIAACIARGLSVAEILEFYHRAGPKMFDSRLSKKLKALVTLGTKYDARPLEGELKNLLGEDTTLEPGHLRCLLLAVTRNQTTDSPWPISSNPAAKYNDPEDPGCNLKIPLWQIVRASAAAPFVFQPEVIRLGTGQEFLFLDGGITPYNNSAWLLYRMATDPAYNLNWERGEDKLLLVSVGTGSSPKGDDGVLTTGPIAQVVSSAKKMIGILIQGTMIDQDTNCRQVGRCVHGPVLDGEIDDMIPRHGELDPEDSRKNRVPLSEDLGRNFLYARYNVHLDRESLDKLGLHDVEVRRLRKLDSIKYIDDLRRIGRRAAGQVDINDFAPFLPGEPGHD
jgi:patatin-like phospholipase/acyl hydrolase